MMRAALLMGVLLSGGASALAEERVKPPSFLPQDKAYYTSECADPFTGWVDPLRAHLVVITNSVDFVSSQMANADLAQCINNTAIWMTMSGNTGKPVRFELVDGQGKVLAEHTLKFGG